MTTIHPQVIDHKPSFWSRPRLFIGACAVVAAGIGGALYTQDSVKSAATLVTTTQQPAAQIMAHKDYLEVQPIASTAPAQIRAWSCGPSPRTARRYPSACCRKMAKASSA